MYLYCTAAAFNGPLEAAHTHIEDDSYDMVVGLLFTCWQTWILLHQVILEAVASLLRTQSVSAVPMCLYSIDTEYNGPLEAAHIHIDDCRYDTVVGWCTASWPAQIERNEVILEAVASLLWSIFSIFLSIANASLYFSLKCIGRLNHYVSPWALCCLQLLLICMFVIHHSLVLPIPLDK